MHWKCQKKCQMLQQKMKDLKLLNKLGGKKKPAVLKKKKKLFTFKDLYVEMLP